MSFPLSLLLVSQSAPTVAPPASPPPAAGGAAADQPSPASPPPATGGAADQPPPASPPPAAGGAAPAAAGGPGMTPLPPPPPAEPTRRIRRGPWRGVGWFGGRAELVVPLGGKQPARGEVVSGGGGLEFGWRMKNFLALRTGMSLAVHDAEVGRVEDVYGNRYTAIEYGQLLGFELLAIRGYLPVTTRFQPYLDAAGGLGLWFPAATDRTEVGGLGRFALGFEGWVSPNFTLGLETAYRLYALDESTGHFLTLGGHLAVHW